MGFNLYPTESLPHTILLIFGLFHFYFLNTQNGHQAHQVIGLPCRRASFLVEPELVLSSENQFQEMERIVFTLLAFLNPLFGWVSNGRHSFIVEAPALAAVMANNKSFELFRKSAV